MQLVSSTYRTLCAAYMAGNANVTIETVLASGDPGVLTDEFGAAVTFGGYRILLVSEDHPSGYDETELITLSTKQQLFQEGTPSVGNCISSEIDVVMQKPAINLPRQAELKPYIRFTDGKSVSEWVQKGVFYVDTRQEKDTGGSVRRLSIHGYDAMLKTEQDYPYSTLSWPATDISVVREICTYLGMEIDPRTTAVMTRGYTVQYPAQYSCRDVWR